MEIGYTTYTLINVDICAIRNINNDTGAVATCIQLRPGQDTSEIRLQFFGVCIGEGALCVVSMSESSDDDLTVINTA